MNRREFALAGVAALLLPTVSASIAGTEKAYAANPKPTAKSKKSIKTTTKAKAMDYDPQYKTAHLYQYGDPTYYETLKPASAAVMQDFVKTANQRYFISQAGTASAPSTTQDDTIITRFNPDTGNSDFMRLVDAGHGIGFDIEYADGKTYVIMCWRGADDSNKLVRFPYLPGEYTYNQVKAKGSFTVLPIQNPELLVHIDWKYGWVVTKHFNNVDADVFQRRQWYEMLQGVDKVYNEITVPINVGVLQGFTTIADTLFRYSGTSQAGGNEPIAIDSYNWFTGARIAYKQYPGLRLNAFTEPEGMSVYREANGKASLLIGLTLGTGSARQWKTYKFAEIGL